MKQKSINKEEEEVEKYLDIIATEEEITEEFLLKVGFKIKVRYPLITVFKHWRNNRIFCSTGKYGEFYLTEYHWCNEDEEVRSFQTINKALTQKDFMLIIRLTGIKL